MCVSKSSRDSVVELVSQWRRRRRCCIDSSDKDNLKAAPALTKAPPKCNYSATEQHLSPLSRVGLSSWRLLRQTSNKSSATQPTTTTATTTTESTTFWICQRALDRARAKKRSDWMSECFSNHLADASQPASKPTDQPTSQLVCEQSSFT